MIEFAAGIDLVWLSSCGFEVWVLLVAVLWCSLGWVFVCGLVVCLCLGVDSLRSLLLFGIALLLWVLNSVG